MNSQMIIAHDVSGKKADIQLVYLIIYLLNNIGISDITKIS